MINNKNKEKLKKYKAIIDEWFVNGFVGSAAYQKYFNVKERTAAANFSRLKEMPALQEYIKEKHLEVAEKIGKTQDGILEELMRWLEADITDTINLSSEEIKKLPIWFRRLIIKYKQTKNDRYDIEGNLAGSTECVECTLVSKEKAMDMVAKHIGFYEIDNKQKIADIDYSKLSAETLKNLWVARK